MDNVTIEGRFRGPPRSGNGGYVAGLLSRLLQESVPSDGQQGVEVTLRAPAPLDTPLRVMRGADRLSLQHGEVLVAEAAFVPLELAVPEPPTWDEAMRAFEEGTSGAGPGDPLFGAAPRGFHPVCFSCGLALSAEEGLRVHACPIPARDLVAAPWTCSARFARPDGTLPPEITWAAIDCPGMMAWVARGDSAGKLTGRMTGRTLRPVHAGERCVVIGWTLGADGRKVTSGTALFDSSGALCVYASAIWFSMVPRPRAT